MRYEFGMGVYGSMNGRMVAYNDYNELLLFNCGENREQVQLMCRRSSVGLQSVDEVEVEVELFRTRSNVPSLPANRKHTRR